MLDFSEKLLALSKLTQSSSLYSGQLQGFLSEILPFLGTSLEGEATFWQKKGQ